MININIDITLLGISVLVFLYFAIFNLIKRFRFIENRLFILSNLSFSINQSILLYQLIYHKPENITELSKYSLSLIMLSHLLYLSIIQLYPRWEKRISKLFIILSAVPGIFAIALTVFKDTIISKTGYNNILINEFGNYIHIFLVVYAFYFLCIIITAVYKFRKMENVSFRSQLPPMFILLCSGMIIFVFLYIILPAFYNTHEYAITGLVACSMVAAFVMNYALSDKRFIDFKKLYLKSLLWIAIIVLLFVPVYFFFEKISKFGFMQTGCAFVMGSIVLFLFYILFYFVLRYITGKIISKSDKRSTDVLNKISQIISDLSDMRKQKIDWDNLYLRSIDDVCSLLEIEKAAFFLLNEESRIYELVHLYNDNVISNDKEISDISSGNGIITALNKYRRIIEKSFLYTDKALAEYKDALKFLTDNAYNVGLPIFTYKNQLIGVVLFGGLRSKKHYSNFISLLEDYKNKLSVLLENLIYSEEIRRIQVIKRDRMVVKNIKKNVIPVSLKNIEGMKISSLYINYSDFGGDYFDSVKIHADKLGIFIANTSDLGIESAMLSLQINSVFHSQANMHESPESLLNILNQVLCTSRFTEKYATTLYIIYNNSSREIAFASAAFNPLIIFDPRKGSFVEFDAEGVPVGIDIAFHYKHRVLTAPYDSVGICYSPGLLTALDKNGNNYSIDKIKDIIRMNKNDNPSALIRKMYDDFKNFSGSNLLNDVTLIIFKTS